MVNTLKDLKYLDDRPVWDSERRQCEAWLKGGREAEMLERKKIQEENKRSYKADET